MSESRVRKGGKYCEAGKGRVRQGESEWGGGREERYEDKMMQDKAQR